MSFIGLNTGTTNCPYHFFMNVNESGDHVVFHNMGQVHSRMLIGYTTCPMIVNWNNNGILDLLVGADDGFFYDLENPPNIDRKSDFIELTACVATRRDPGF